MRKIKGPTLFQALLPIVLLMGMIALNVIFVPDDTLDGANQLSILLVSAVASIIAIYNGIKWSAIMDNITSTISTSMPSILILFIIGMLSGTWMLSGIIPTMIYYGLSIIKPEFFLPATIILCAIISVAVGSSWSTVATVGVALCGVGEALGFNLPIVAGAIISGAYFGDKISPLSDTTNLAAAMGNVPLFTHIKFMLKTTTPAFIISLIIFIILTFTVHNTDVVDSSKHIQEVISSYYNISPWLLLVPFTVIIMIVKKLPAIAVLLAGSLIAGIVAIIAQPQIIAKLSADGVLDAKNCYLVISKALYGSLDISTGDATVDSLVTTGGMKGMLNTIWLIITAMTFGGVLEAGKLLEKIISLFIVKVKNAGSAVTTAASATMLFNLTAGDQYLAIMIPGKMFSNLFKRLKLPPQLLTRTLEDAGTVTSVLIPWNTCGATQSAILGVATAAYAPYAFFCYLSPIITILFAWLKIGIVDKKQVETELE